MRTRLYLLLTLALSPVPLQGQSEPPLEIPRVSLSLYTGARVPFVTGTMTAFAPDGTVLLQAREERGGAAVLGVEGEVGFGGPLRFMIGGMASQAGRGDFYINRDPDSRTPSDLAVQYTGTSWFAKAGLSYRIQSNPSLADDRRHAATDFFLAPAIVRELGSTHPGVNFGVKGAFPLSYPRGVEVNVGVEDYLIFWRHDELDRSMSSIWGDTHGAQRTEFLYDTSNRLVLRIGASLRR